MGIPEQRGRVIVITGASSGIGRVTAEVSVQRGARLVLLNRDERTSQRFVAQLRAQGGRAGLMKLTMRSEQEGASTTLHCATTPDLGRLNGGYFDDSRERAASRWAQDEQLARELWERSEAWAGDGMTR